MNNLDGKIKEKATGLYAFLEDDNSNIMDTPKKVSAREKKLKQITNKFGDVTSQASNGFLMGAVVGSAMGAIIGVWTVMKTRKLIVLPISILTSGAFFGFIMMVGSIVRTDTENIYITSQPETAIPFWRIKYAAANPITGMNTSC